MKIIPSGGYMPQTQRKHIQTAYNYCIEHGLTECKVNTMCVSFNFENKTGEVRYKLNGETLRARFAFK